VAKNPLGPLRDLALFLREGEDLQAHLRELAELAAGATEAAACSVMLLSEGDEDAPRLKLWCASQDLPAPAWERTPGRGEGIAGRVLDSGQPLLIADIARSEYAPLAHGREELGASFICAPVVVGRHVIGVINLSNRAGAPPFGADDLRLAEIVAALIGKSVQVERLQTLIRSRVAHLSLAQQERQVVARLTDGSVPPARLAKLLAKSFFRDLSAAGFEPGQIIEAASEIIGLVSSDIRRFKQRKARGQR